MGDEKNTDQGSGKTPWDLLLTILRDRKLLMIALPIAVVGVAIYIYLHQPIHTDPGPPPHPSCTSWTLTGRLVSDSDEYLSIKGIKLGVESDPFPHDDQITDGIFTMAGFTIPKDNIIGLYLEGNGHVSNFFRTRFDSSVIRPDYNSCVLTFGEDIRVHDADLKPVKPPSNPSPPPSHLLHLTTFSINIDDDVVRNQIAQLSGYKYDPASPAKKVIVTFDSTKIISTGSVYTFMASSPIVLIGNRNFKLSGCTIPAPAFPSHDKQVIMDEVRTQTESIVIPYLRSHANLIAKWITGS